MDIFGIAGWSGSGKTTLIRALIPVLATRGLVVGTLKHSHHHLALALAAAEDEALAAAGAVETVLAGPERAVLLHPLAPGRAEPPLAALAARLAGIDLLLVEGYKFNRHPRLEVWNSALGKPMLAATEPAIIAVATDLGRPDGLPLQVEWFHRDEVERIADLIQANCIPLGELHH